jgi:hypothetical protein
MNLRRINWEYATFWTIYALALVGFLLFAVGCGEAPARPADPPATVPTAPADPAATSREARIAQLEKDIANATAEKNDVARLAGVNELLALEAAQSDAAAARAHEESAAATAEYKAAKKQAWIDAQETRLYWFAGILGLLALVGIGVSIFQPALAKWAVRFAIACGALAGVAVFAVQLLPYLWWLGAAVVAIGAGAYMWWNRLSDKTKTQVIAAVEAKKAEVPTITDGFSKVIDTDAEKMVSWTRKHLGLTKP